MSNELMKQEMKQAIAAGERALSSLYVAQDRLNSARNWGALDMFGGGIFITMMKRSKVSEASTYVESAKRDLAKFQKELQDVSLPLNMKIEIGSFLSFADFFFDGFVADYLVQNKIANAREQISDAIIRVQRILGDLKHRYGQM